jgi:hypothetical protein
MFDDTELRAKLRKIEALFAGAGTAGEKAAAGAAADRIRAKLERSQAAEPAIEFRFALHDPWGRKLFVALCRRYGLRPYREHRMKRQSVMLKAPRSFVEGVLWPEFQEINAELRCYLDDITEKVIREEVDRDTTEAEELREGRRNR